MPPALAELIDAELVKPWHVRRDGTLRALYETRRESVQRQSARISAQIAGIVYILFAVTDVVLINDVSVYSIVARIVIGLIFVVGIDSQINRGARSMVVDAECAAAIILAYGAWLSIASFSRYQENVSHYITYGIVFMLGQNVFFNFRFRLAAASSTIILVSFLVYMVTVFPFDPNYATAIGALYVSTWVLTLFVNWKLNAERYLVFLNSVHAEIRQEEAVERGAALLRLSTTDALTGLSNRRAIDEELRAFWDNWQTAAKSFAVILIDVDYFKRYNDHYGHQEGDRCLVAIAAAMASVATSGRCALGRFGGEEFILLARAATREQMALVAEDIRRAVEALQIPHAQRPDQSFVVTVSVGAAFSRDVPGTKAERLITEADRALYNAKNANRNCVRVYDRDDPNQLDLDESVADLLRTATRQNRVAMAYQPIRSAGTGAIAAAEALMRLTTPSGKSVSPAVFIPIAERMGTILDLGLWAIRTACRELVASDLVPLVSVNVSPVQLRAPGFSLSVAAILGELGVAPHRLAVEITEGLQIEGQSEIVQTLSELRLLGVRIWLDDFGTGFAGLSVVREIEFDAVKIDRSFLHASDTAKGAEMFRNIVDLVRNTGCATVVEGIQTQDQQDLSTEQRVDLLQGYHLGRPMPAEAFRRLVAPGEARAAPV